MDFYGSGTFFVSLDRLSYPLMALTRLPYSFLSFSFLFLLLHLLLVFS